MRLLLDTHTFIWFIEDDPKLSEVSRNHIEDDANEVFLGIASLWEIAIKMSIGKLDLGQDINGLALQLDENDIALLSISTSHLAVVATMPRHHGDPFDCLLIAQAQVEGMPIVGAAPAFDAYGVQRLW